jgi:hypothetical protein
MEVPMKFVAIVGLLAVAGCFGDTSGLGSRDAAGGEEAGAGDGAAADRSLGPDIAGADASADASPDVYSDLGADLGGPDLPPPTCDPFVASTCEAGHRCSECADPRVCEGAGTIGKVQPGEVCANSNDCVLGAICASWVDRRCHALCDAAHPCPSGTHCTEPLCPDNLYKFCR